MSSEANFTNWKNLKCNDVRKIVFFSHALYQNTTIRTEREQALFESGGKCFIPMTELGRLSAPDFDVRLARVTTPQVSEAMTRYQLSCSTCGQTDNNIFTSGGSLDIFL